MNATFTKRSGRQQTTAEIRERRTQILNVAVSMCCVPGGWINLTRSGIAHEVGCSVGLVSKYLGSMDAIREAVARRAKRENLTAIITQSIAANDGYLR